MTILPDAVQWIAKQEAIPMTDNERTYPAIDVILRDWLTTKAVADMHDMTVENVTYLCREVWQDEKNAIQIGRQWYVRPETAAEYERTGTGRPRKSS